LEAVFESLGRACVHRLVAAPHPFGLPPQDRLAAERWLSRGTWIRQTQQWKRDLTIILGLVATGLAAAFVILWLYPAGAPQSDAVRRSTAAMVVARD
jgi:hypothetical protein